MILHLAALVSLAGSPSVPAAVADTTFLYPLPLLDLGITASRNAGVAVLAAPSMLSKQGADSAMVVSLDFHPDSLLEWLNSAAAALSRPAIVAPSKRIQWSRELRSLRGSGHFAIGRTVEKGKLQRSRWLAIADSLHAWTLELTGPEADSLLALLFAASAQAGLVESREDALPYDSVDAPVQVVHQPVPRDRGIIGRVFTRYLVGTDGRTDPASIIILLSSSPVLSDLAREVLLASRYTPARKHGLAVRQVVQQAIYWRRP